MRIKYKLKIPSFFFLALLLSMTLLSGTSNNITFFDNVYSQKKDNTSALSDSINNINTLQQGGAGFSKDNQQSSQQQPVNKKPQFNHYENSKIGVSLKYPSKFLVDESNSNNTLRQISFYPESSINLGPENHILWMDVFVQSLDSAKQPLMSLSNPNSVSSSSSLPTNNNSFLASYSLNLANNIQQTNKDITIVSSSTNTTLSGYPAYKLITTSYVGNSAITDVLISTIVDNAIYSIDYQTHSSNYAKSLFDANNIIQSFKIVSSPSSSTFDESSNTNNNNIQNPNLTNTTTTTTNSAAVIPFLSNLLSSLQIKGIANNSADTINTLKNSISSSLTDILSNPKNAIDKSLSGSASIIQNPPPIPLITSPSDLSSLSSDAVKKTCNLPIVSTVCNKIKNTLDSNKNSINNGNTNSISSINKNETNSLSNSNSSNNANLDNAISAIIVNSLLNQGKNNSLSQSLNGLLGSNNSKNGSLSLNETKALDSILLENLIKHLTPTNSTLITPNQTNSSSLY